MKYEKPVIQFQAFTMRAFLAEGLSSSDDDDDDESNLGIGELGHEIWGNVFNIDIDII